MRANRPDIMAHDAGLRGSLMQAFLLAAVLRAKAKALYYNLSFFW